MEQHQEVQHVQEVAVMAEMPSLQALAAAALLQSPNRRCTRGHSKNKRDVMLTQMGLQPIARTQRNRRLWNTAKLVRVFHHRIPDMVVEEIQHFDEPGNPPRIYVGIVHAASVFTTGRILRLTEDPHGTAGCHATICNAGVNMARRVYNSIDQVSFEEVVWRTESSVVDIENRCVPAECFHPAPVAVHERHLLGAFNVDTHGARTEELIQEDDELNPPSPPAPLRRSSRKRKC